MQPAAYGATIICVHGLVYIAESIATHLHVCSGHARQTANDNDEEFACKRISIYIHYIQRYTYLPEVRFITRALVRPVDIHYRRFLNAITPCITINRNKYIALYMYTCMFNTTVWYYVVYMVFYCNIMHIHSHGNEFEMSSGAYMYVLCTYTTLYLEYRTLRRWLR